MAYKIIADNCSACGACESECPNQAISMSEDGSHSVIDASKCKECAGSFDNPRCAEVCPSDACVPA